MTSVTISTTVTYNSDSGGGGSDGHYASKPHDAQGGYDQQDIGNQYAPQGGNAFGTPSQQDIVQMIQQVLSKLMGATQSQSSAVDTMQKFQNDHKDKLGLISYDQMKDIASGKTDQINGVHVPDDVKDAAKTYVANNGELFKMVESATDGKHDSQLGAGDPDHVDRSKLSNLPTLPGTGPNTFMQACANGHISRNEPDEYDAVKTMSKFQKDNNIGLVSYDQMKDIASGKTTALNGATIPDDVKEAAKAYVADHGALFDKIESATNGKHDSQLGAGDADQALKKGLVDVPPMSEKQAVSAMEDFQKNGGPGLVSYDQMQDIASGKTTSLNGKDITPEVKAAAQAYVANNGALFDKVESATDGKHDSQLGAGDPEQARKKGIALSDRAPGGNNDIPASSSLTIKIDLDDGNPGFFPSGRTGRGSHVNGNDQPAGGSNPARDTQAVEAMERFQNDGGPKLVSYDQMKDIASGKTTSLNGKAITPEVKAAAQAYVADDGALFDKVESATDGKHDSQLGAGDPAQARKKGLVGMSDSKAVDTIAALQNNPLAAMSLGLKKGEISYDQMKEIADTGKVNGHDVPPDIRAAANAYMANNGALFDKVESATDGKHDSILGRGDPGQARDKGLIAA